MNFTDEELTKIYKEANSEVGKARPLTTASIFKAMRVVADVALERAATVAESEPKVWDLDAPSPQQRISAKIRAMKGVKQCT